MNMSSELSCIGLYLFLFLFFGLISFYVYKYAVSSFLSLSMWLSASIFPKEVMEFSFPGVPGPIYLSYAPVYVYI